ncbi:hypothetical protein HanRHA438_Chr01g0009761 [Helianthus annuus]|nr:hypothetical protein HanRHA438_Chr01g0009761 [Helianthus annuus]
MGLSNGSIWVSVSMGIGQDRYFKKRVGWGMGQHRFGLEKFWVKMSSKKSKNYKKSKKSKKF